jgi:lipopolysaccharide/colanic/teichoic acid biosynthesis glycosyltransferase
VDIVVAAALIALLWPVMVLLWALVRATMGGPALYRQERPGLGGRPFTMVKFRTMSAARGADGRLLPDDERITRLGYLLRRTGLDELPELFNVLRGEMSLVGPRPLVKAYLARYTPEQARRHEVRPGMTGLAQINGRNALCWERRFELDVFYVDHHNLWLDFRIMAATAAKLLLSDADTDGSVLSPTFVGTVAADPRTVQRWDPEHDIDTRPAGIAS